MRAPGLGTAARATSGVGAGPIIVAIGAGQISEGVREFGTWIGSQGPKRSQREEEESAARVIFNAFGSSGNNKKLSQEPVSS